MDRELSVIVIEDDDMVCKCFKNFAETMDEISIVECTNDSNKGIELVKQYIPDAVILDLELNEGKGSGIDFLTGIKAIEDRYKPFVLVTTNVSSTTMQDYVRKNGADFIISKHKKDYSEKEALDFLISMKDMIQGKAIEKDEHTSLTESMEKRDNRLKKMICKELDYVGINPKHLGYDYLVDAILLVIGGEKSKTITIIGEKYGKTDSSIERAMQNAINKAWRSSDIDELLEHYTARINSEKGVPTLMEFVHYYAKKLKG